MLYLCLLFSCVGVPLFSVCFIFVDIYKLMYIMIIIDRFIGLYLTY